MIYEGQQAAQILEHAELNTDLDVIAIADHDDRFSIALRLQNLVRGKIDGIEKMGGSAAVAALTVPGRTSTAP